ncbi:MAG: sn-glycerol-3-phosphate ABC transporter ATP-binding protein UgpC [Chloroflexota bacterium]|nr:sn-glycerol-3-phosphate ABC transporter ATP-binding protein UgpC [Dehalococcoidia bacterium]MDW8252296.1 sn-glycerol-3-phosphate ABC transporter ATP-binding protein UgpC [Chloroflexota bacterium]
MATVEFEHIEKRFKTKHGSVTAVHDLTLEVRDGEFLVLVGPSGCGKTTALRLVAGLEVPTAGLLRIGGRVVNDVPPKDRDIAMVFQNYALYPHMSVYDNLAFGLKMRRLPKAEIDRLIRDAAEMLEIGDLLKRKPKELSGGQRQRVALGRAIVRQPQVFLMDEPLSNLDAKLRVQTRAELIKLHRRLGVTTIYVTHDQTEAMTMGTRIAVMSGGVLQQLDTPQRLYDAPVNRFVAGFIGSPSMSFLEGARLDDGALWVEGVSLPLPAEAAARLAGYRGRTVVLGLRPEAVRPPRPGEEGAALSLPVEVVEPLGSDVYVTLRLGGQTLLGRFDPRLALRPGANTPVALDLAAARFFDPATGLAIGRAA